MDYSRSQDIINQNGSQIFELIGFLSGKKPPGQAPKSFGAGKDANAKDSARFIPEAISLVTDALSRLRYGAIQLTVHDGKVLQVDVTEKRRLGD